LSSELIALWASPVEGGVAGAATVPVTAPVTAEVGPVATVALGEVGALAALTGAASPDAVPCASEASGVDEVGCAPVALATSTSRVIDESCCA
jgi:hypothetical protein